MEFSGQELLTMEPELYKAALEGDEGVFNKNHSDEYLERKTLEKNNIMHIAIRSDESNSEPLAAYHNEHTDFYRHYYFVEKAVIRLPQLMYEQNSDGNNPFHIAAEVGDVGFVALCYQHQGCGRDMQVKTLLEMRNSTGNTPLHVALMYRNYAVATILVEVHPTLVKIVNDFKEAPLHLAVKHFDTTADYGEFLSMEQRAEKRYPEETGGLLEQRYGWSHNRLSSGTLGEAQRKMLSLLLEAECNVACWRDTNGLTPLHSAALLEPKYNLKVIKIIVECCPQSAEVCDSTKKSIIHHLVNKITNLKDGIEIFKCVDIRALRNRQDQQGNTPLHLAIINKDIVMVNLLLNMGVNFTISNKDGFSAATLIKKSKIFDEAEKRIMTKDECEAAKEKNVLYLREKIENFGSYVLTSRDLEGKNFLHKLLRIEKKTSADFVPLGYMGFLLHILKISPNIVMETDHSGDTPFHVFARNDPEFLLRMIADGKVRENELDDATGMKYGVQIDYLLCRLYSAALIPNLQGNTPIHEAIIAKNDQILIRFCNGVRKVDATTTSYNAGINNRKESVAHLIASRNPMSDLIDESVIRDLHKVAGEGLYSLDEDGLSPSMRAFKAGNFEFADKLCSIFPKSVQVQDLNGQTIWHQLVTLPPASFNIADSSFTNGPSLSQLAKQDKNGNTPLHLALEHSRFDLAELFLSQDESKTHDGTPVLFMTPLCNIRNKMGVTPADLIGSLAYLPPKFEKYIRKKPTMIGIRSMWGIPTAHMKDYINTMSAIAAFLTAITFIVAFTITEGGLEEEKGTPLLVRIAAFQVSMISNALSMCLSMMVLFCVLCIMVTGDRRKSVVLLDFSIILLLGSFYTTILTFMTRLYATTYLVEPWIAIVCLVLCSLVLFLMHKYLVIKFILPSGMTNLIFVDKAFTYVSGLSNEESDKVEIINQYKKFKFIQ